MIIECFENNAMFFFKCYVSFHKHVRRLSSKGGLSFINKNKHKTT